MKSCTEQSLGIVLRQRETEELHTELSAVSCCLCREWAQWRSVGGERCQYRVQSGDYHFSNTNIRLKWSDLASPFLP